MNLFSKYSIADKVVFQPIPHNHDLTNAYLNSSLLIYPSLYEGFGLPIIEAFTCGCPVITNNISSMPEIGGDAAFYCDMSNPEEISKSIEALVADKDLSDKLIKRGLERATQFTWENCVQQTKGVYKDLV